MAAEAAAVEAVKAVEPAVIEPIAAEEPKHEVEDGDETPPEQQDGETSAGWKKRIDRFNRRIAEKEAEAEHWKKVALEGARATPVQEPVVSDEKPDISNFDDITAFTEALTDWKVRQAMASREAETKRTEVTRTYQQRVTDFIKSKPDFNEVLAEVGDIPASPEIHQVIIESEVGPALAYHLAQHPDEMRRINGLAPHRRLIEMGKLEDKLTPKETPTAAPAPVSKAPVPIKAEKGAAPVKKDLNDPNLSQAEYRELRAKQLGRRYR